MTLTSVIPLGFFVFLFLCCDFYICFRIYQCLHGLFPGLGIIPFAILCVLLLLIASLSFIRSSLPISTPLKYALSVFGGYWLGAFVYLLILFALSDLVLLILGVLRVLPLPAGEKIRTVTGIAVMAASAVIIVCGVIHANNFVHRSYTVETGKELGGREWNIVLISDVHLGALNSEERLEKMVEEINSLAPDIVCICGDIFDNDINAIRHKELCAETLRRLRPGYGVYACLGNHDRGETEDEMVAFAEECGITLLREDSVVIDGRLTVLGRLDSQTDDNGNALRRPFAAAASDADPALPAIVLDHDPSHIDEYPDWVDLILCGHTHRGQLFPGSLFTKRLFTVDYGQYRRDESSPTVIVSSGVGTWGPPIRVGTDSEIVSVRMVSG